MKRTITLMLVVCLCMVALFGCAKDSPKQKILPDIAEALEIDDKEAAEVEALFKTFDKAFAQLGKNPTDEDFYEYASAIADAAEQFDELFKELRGRLSEKLDRAGKAGRLEEVSAYIDIIAQYSNISKIPLLDGLINSSGEACAEEAFNLVNEYSRFFYGIPWITEEDLDRLG